MSFFDFLSINSKILTDFDNLANKLINATNSFLLMNFFNSSVEDVKLIFHIVAKPKTSNFGCILHLEHVTQSIIEDIFLNLIINSDIF